MVVELVLLTEFELQSLVIQMNKKYVDFLISLLYLLKVDIKACFQGNNCNINIAS